MLRIIKYIYFSVICLILTSKNSYSQSTLQIDTLQYPKGYPNSLLSVSQQLHSYPLPRYFSSHNLQRLFNWMDPNYMGGQGQPNIKTNTAIINAAKIQEELITTWYYGIVITNSGTAFTGPLNKGCPMNIDLANKYPNVSLDVTTLWTQVRPKKAGYEYKNAIILEKNLHSSFYYHLDSANEKNKLLKLTLPDSIVQIDGYTQKYYLEQITKFLKRPINRINENGEEPPAVSILKILKKDSGMIKLKSETGITSWEEFMAIQKLHLRNTYSSSFMNEIPELKNTKFNFYAVEGGPIDRFEWSVMKKCMTPVNGIYYSTPDFYPRWPKNWKDWMGAWHGWKWIETGRKKEIKDGDYLFSPFVAAGWSKKQQDDIRPAQWLGLLKSLAVVGAEFYYVGYFSLSAPFNDPSTWVWQAVMPSYAQAITSRYEDVLKNGNVLFDEKSNPIISFKTSDKHVLITIRKHNQKEKYIICGTYQPFTNEAKEIPESKNVTIKFNNQELTFEIRKQGSVYVYEKALEGKTLFYQLDKWHENAHPDYWSKDFYFEAEVSDIMISNNVIYTEDIKNNSDFTSYTTFVRLENKKITSYKYCIRDSIEKTQYLWIKYRGNGKLCYSIKDIHKNPLITKLPNKREWTWFKIKLPNIIHGNTLRLHSIKGIIDLDKLIISSSETIPTL
jgi:hypothetical protein